MAAVAVHPLLNVPAPFEPQNGIKEVEGLPHVDLSMNTTQEAHAIISQAAVNFGVVTIDGIPIKAPFATIRKLFDLILTHDDLIRDLDATYPKRGVVKRAGLIKGDVDQKVSIDIAASRLESILTLPQATRDLLGEDLKVAIDFFREVQDRVVPLLMESSSAIAGVDLKAFHRTSNFNYRMVDYLPRLRGEADRCGEHRDYGTFTVIFQDGTAGLEVQDPAGNWRSVPGQAQAIIVWGNCANILSGDVLKAVNHRVVKTGPLTDQRRNTAILFVAPDLDVALKPRAGRPEAFNALINSGQVNVEEFKAIVGRQWRYREGNEEGDRVVKQDEVVQAFIRA